VAFVDAVIINNNKLVFSVDDPVLIKLLRQQRVYDAKKFIAEFPSNLWTLSGCLILDTSRFEVTLQKSL